MTERQKECLKELGMSNEPCNYFVDYERDGDSVYRYECYTQEEALRTATIFAKKYKKPVQINKVLVRSKITTKIEFIDATTNKPIGVKEL